MLNRTTRFNNHLYLNTYNKGAVLIVSLLLLSILTMLSLSVMNDSHLVFKSQAVRLQYQRALYRADKVSALALKVLEKYLLLREWSQIELPSGFSLDAKGQAFFDAMLSMSEFSNITQEQAASQLEANPVRLFFYKKDGVLAEISISPLHKVSNIAGAEVMQHRSYGGIHSSAAGQVSTSHYFQVHCVVEFNRGSVSQKAHTISDYRVDL